jgi:hypothetical protein
MAFVNFDDIKNLTPGGWEKELMKPDVFEYLEAEAGKTVTEITGVASPADIADRPDWVVQPMAYIMLKLLSLKATQSKEFLEIINDNYTRAIEFLTTKKIKGPVTETVWGLTGTLDNLLEI